MPRLKKEAMKRLNLVLSLKTRQLIEKLQTETQADSMSEVIRMAVTAYDFIITETHNGNKFFMDRNGTKTEIKFLT